MAASRWTSQNVRHAAGFAFGYGRNPAARVYESIGPANFFAPAPGWLNLGLWEGPGTEDEAPAAVRRLVERLAGNLPAGGAVVDVGNGLGAQDPVVASVVRPSALTAVNVTEAQLRAGRERLREAGARAVVGDAVRLPLRARCADGVISVEAAFHFASRRVFFEEAFRVLRPGGILSMSDVPTRRMPRTPGELVAGVGQLRLWGLPLSAVAAPEDIAAAVSGVGFVDVSAELVGDRVIEPALRLVKDRLRGPTPLPRSQHLAAALFVRHVDLLWRRGLIEYLLLSARKP
ncbi:MAG TPA: methyltransferase domain-containing protein [Actinomycetota bacterium]|nr:methyltransferase domain-containing protein [Actinomycetota bacterium]